VGGNRELVEDGKTGLLVPPGDAAALANAVTRLIRDKPLAAACAHAAHALVRERFSIEAMIDKTERLYERLLADGDSHAHRVS
jgi:L-malate glycosyltransferase